MSCGRDVVRSLGVRHFGATRNFLFYLSFIAEFFIVFLVAAASLPDRPSDGTDLREYYSRTRRYFWTLLTLFQALYVADGLYFSRGESDRFPHWVTVAFTLSLIHI